MKTSRAAAYSLVVDACISDVRFHGSASFGSWGYGLEISSVFFFFFLYDGVDIDIKECVICKRVMECAEVNKEVFLIS